MHLKKLKEVLNVQLKDLPNDKLTEHYLSLEKHLQKIGIFIYNVLQKRFAKTLYSLHLQCNILYLHFIRLCRFEAQLRFLS